tara:strand:- start:5325 stop:5522 length:198 start_codon:yes stop_codon:yes gene_type:complete
MAKKKIKKFPKKHKLVEKGIMSEKDMKILDPLAVDSILMPLLKGKKKFMGGAVMKNRGGTFKGTY